MKVEIISVGSELVSGKIMDRNAPFIASKLTEIGLVITSQTIVGDDIKGLKSVLHTALGRANLILITGGLGPTVDDITRETVADLCGVKLIADEKSMNHIERLTVNIHGQMYANNLKQAMIPEGGIVIRNLIGTSQGFLINFSRSNIICLPGVHTEMKLMLEDWVIPFILRKTDKRKKRCIRVINTFGMSESMLDKKIRQLITPDEYLSFGTLVKDGIVSIHIEACSEKEDKVVSILDEAEEIICRELGVSVFSKGKEMLEDVVSKLLKEHNVTLAVAESCTGGLVSNLLTNIQGSSKFFLEGIVSYSSKAKMDLLNVPKELIEKFGVVSADVTKAMADGIKKRARAHIGLGITGIAGPTGIDEQIDSGKPVGLIYVAVSINNDMENEEYRFFGSRVDIKKHAANAALNILRLCLLKKTVRH
ncbi:MAG: competence/damage-inducible protein A [Candidatus Scalinduaceae bacterium]